MIAGIALCFTAASAIGEYLDRAIIARAGEISANAMPSVQLLNAAWGHLRRLDADLDRYAMAPAEQRAELRDRIAATQREVAAAVAPYAALPLFPDERPLHADLQRSLARLDRALADFLLSDTEEDALASTRRERLLAAEAVERIVSFNAAQGRRLGLEIQRIHGESRGVVELLDAASIVLAIGAVYLAIRQLRRAARAQAEREARERRAAELAAQNEALGQFAGRVAHDVLSPLSTAMLSLELLRHTCERDAAAQRATDRAIAAITRVHTLVDGLLAFSRAGGQPEPGASTEIAPVIADVVEGFAAQAREQRIALTVGAVPHGPEAAIACSKGVLTSALSNLVGNAIKYMGSAPERRIELRAVDAGARWRIEVEDTGPGIAPEHQARIFQPYVQLTCGTAGIGLGLATVDRLVRGHAGTLGVSSTPGRGSVFWFELPRPIAPPPGLVPDRAAREHA